MFKKLALISFVFTGLACSNVPPGNVGIIVNQYGSDKGVNQEVRGVGRVWLSWNENLYLFPTFQQNYVWTQSPHEGHAHDESITFQTKEGMDVNIDVGISYHLNPEKVAVIFQKYRKGIEEITDIYLRNIVRDSIVELGSKLSVEDVYGVKKNELFADINKMVSSQLTDQGIVIDKVYLVGSARLPANVVAALNSKIEATQRAQQRENEVQEARAQAAKEIAKAQGDATAALTRAEAEAKANKLKQTSLTPELVRYEAIRKWSGNLPTYMGGGATPFINFTEHNK